MKSICFVSFLVMTTFFFSIPVHCQTFDFGRISEKDMNLDYYREKYPEDYAVMIGDKALCRFVYNNSLKEFQFRFERTYRLLILDERGQNLGNIDIPFYSSKADSEVISKLQAIVYNKEGKKLVRHRVRQKDGFIEETGNKWNSLKLPLPNVRPGSVIEINYTLTSGFLSQLRSWQFQYEFPVEYSEYELIMPSIFKYRMYYRGFVELEESSLQELTEQFHVQKNSSGSYGEPTKGSWINIIMKSGKFRWLAEDVPAFRQEPYTDNYRNYLASMNFEYIGTQYPDLPADNVSETWEDVSRVLYEKEDFGGYLEKAKEELLSGIPFMITEGGLKHNMDRAVTTIQERVRWDASNSIFSSLSPDKVLEVGQGNSAEVNLLLCALLQNAGVDAHPVLLSTRNRGAIMGNAPTLVQFNYLMVGVPDSTNTVILLDASEDFLKAGYIPQRTVNGQGRLITPTTSRWVPLVNPGLFHQKRTYDLTLNADGSLSGIMQYHYYDYAKLLINGALNYIGESDSVIEYIESELNAQISDHSVFSSDDLAGPLTISGNFRKADFATSLGGEIFLHALLFESTQNQVLKQEERQYPVFFDQRSLSEIEITIKLPQGIQIIEAPFDQEIRWGSNFYYDYRIFAEENILKVNCRIHIGTQKIEARHYSQLKEFFDLIIIKNLEQFVLSDAM